jgi:hypothetical protein
MVVEPLGLPTAVDKQQFCAAIHQRLDALGEDLFGRDE